MEPNKYVCFECSDDLYFVKGVPRESMAFVADVVTDFDGEVLQFSNGKLEKFSFEKVFKASEDGNAQEA